MNQIVYYTFNNPFVVTTKKGKDPSLFIETMTPENREDEDRLNLMIFKFADSEKMIRSVEVDNQRILRIDPGNNPSSWRWRTTMEDFRSFVYLSNLDKYIDCLTNSAENAQAKIINLHFRIGSLFEERFLNTIVNRIYRSIEIVPYFDAKLEDTDNTIDWEEIHTRYPWLWVTVLIQIVLKSEIQKVIRE